MPTYVKELKKAILPCESLLDVGCGSNSPIKSFSHKFKSTGADSFRPSIRESKKQGIHQRYYVMNVMDLDKKFRPNSFDIVLASDLIEHLKKEDGIRLIRMMEKIAKKKIIIMTPNGFMPQDEYDDNPHQLHKSGWFVKEMKKRGYLVNGMYGLKSLREKYNPQTSRFRYLWLFLSDITQPFVYTKPEKAFHILCIKTK